MNFEKSRSPKKAKLTFSLCAPAGRPWRRRANPQPKRINQLREQRRLERGHDRREAARRLLLLPRDAADPEGAKERLVARPVAE